MPKKTINKKSRVRKMLETHFGMTLPEIVSTHFPQGISRYKAADKLRELMGWDGSEENQPFSTSSLWNIVKDAISLGEIKDFDFGGKRNKKQNNNQKEKAIKTSKIEETPEKSPVIVENKTEIIITFTCKSCNRTHEESLTEINPQRLFLRAHKCPSCLSIGKSKAEFEINGSLIRKDVILDQGYIRECFVNEFGEKIKNNIEQKIQC